jgi:hypothetical protein
LTPAAAADTLPLSLEQEWCYALRLLRPDQRLSLSLGLDIRGPLDTKAFLDAIRVLYRRHSGLRVRLAFTDRGERGQTVLPADDAAPVTIQAIASASRQQFDAYVRRSAAADRRARWNPVRDPLLAIRLLRRAPGEHVLIGTFDQLAFDQRAVLIFERDLWLAYRHLRGEPGTGCPAGSDLAEAVGRQRHRYEDQAKANGRFWAGQYALAPRPSARPAAPGPAGQVLVRREIAPVPVAAGSGSGASDRAAAVMAASALAELTFRRGGQDRLAIYLTVDTRDDGDDNLIGMLTAARPLVVSGPGGLRVQLADQLSQVLAHRHLPGQAQCDLEARDTAGTPCLPHRDLLVDYAADRVAARPADLTVVSTVDGGPQGGGTVSLALVGRAAAGSLRLDMCYDQALVSEAEAATLSGLIEAEAVAEAEGVSTAPGPARDARR